MQRDVLHGLYIITDDSIEFDILMKKTELALMGGASIIQYRTNTTDEEIKFNQATKLISICHDYHVPFILNNDIALARVINADGVHLGKNDMGYETARKILGPGKIIGVSCYDNINLAREAQDAGADYIALGSFYKSTTKPEATRVSLELLNKTKELLNIPIVAIGGITPENAIQLIENGADMLAVISAIYAAEDSFKITQQFVELFNIHDKKSV